MLHGLGPGAAAAGAGAVALVRVEVLQQEPLTRGPADKKYLNLQMKNILKFFRSRNSSIGALMRNLNLEARIFNEQEFN